MKKQNLIIVSNRLPISVSKHNGKLTYTPSSGGLATAMASLGGKVSDRLWIGWPGISSDELTAADKSAITRKLAGYGCYPVFLAAKQVDNFYAGYANDTLWPLFHYFQSYAQYDNAYWEAYQEVNAIFKRAIVKHADANTSIWIHDYHLMILPRLLREALPQSAIGFFLHIPFPSYEIFRMLPNRKEILEGLLGADLVGFHIYDYARHFLSSVLRILGLESSHGSVIMGNRVVKADAFPIGIDYQKFVAALDDDTTKAEMATLHKHYQGQKILLSVDRLDYSKGIMKRLEAFDQFLKQYPSYHKKVALVIVAVPSRTEVDTYRDLRDEVEKAIGRINGAYGRVDWTPISYQFKNLPFEQVVALYAAADVALLTPLRDGMNLVAKEYVASKQHQPGVLILSEMTGAVDELPEALRINPNDIDSIVAAVKKALAMPKKQQLERLASMQNRLSQYTVQRWAADFTEQLEKSKEDRMRQSSKLLTTEQKAKIARRFHAAKHRLILLDYDGTLRTFTSSPDHRSSQPPQQLMRTLKRLTSLPNTTVCIISGRPRSVLDSWFGRLPLTLAAEHGARVKYNGEWSQQQDSLREYKQALMPILYHYEERTPGARVEEKEFSVVWHYRNVPEELAYARNASLRYELNQVLASTDIAVYNGAKIIEIKPRGVHKGTVAEDMLALRPADFVLCVGDDYTDEDMFKVLPEEAYSIKVGLADTRARYQVLAVEDVLQLLRGLASAG